MPPRHPGCASPAVRSRPLGSPSPSNLSVIHRSWRYPTALSVGLLLLTSTAQAQGDGGGRTPAADAPATRPGTDSAGESRVPTRTDEGTTSSGAAILADSVAPGAPVFQLTDLLSGRLHSTDVQSAGAQSGSGARIIVRGVGSIFATTDPAVYVDGVRVASDRGGAADPANPAQSHPVGPSRIGTLDELSPWDIARIDVLTGPAATTEYGLDAANGVVLVTTRRPSTDALHWAFSSEVGALGVPSTNQYESWMAWGHATGGTTQVRCGPVPRAAGTCVLDSLTHFSPLATTRTSPLTGGNRDAANLQLDGGTGPVRYLVSGERQNERGILAMPTPEAQLYAAQDGHAPPNAIRWPNRLDRTNGHASVTTALPALGEVTITGSAIGGGQGAANESLLATDVASGSGTAASNDGWAGGPARPRYLFANESADRVERYDAGASWIWTPVSWLSTHANGGVDKGRERNEQYLDPADDPFDALPGMFTRDRIADHSYSASLAVSGTAEVPGLLSAVTTVGGAYREIGYASQSIVALNLLSGVNPPTGTVQQMYTSGENAQRRGAFLEEAVTFLDRLSVTGAVRRDAYGEKGAPEATYGRAAISWLAIRHRSNPLRLHAAIGETGDLPPVFNIFVPNLIDGRNGIGRGGPLPRPEHIREYEAGADASIRDRVTLSASVYDKTTTDALFPAQVSTGGVAATIELNDAAIRNRGVEIEADATVIRTGGASWDVGLGGWANQNRLVSLAPGLPQETYGASPVFLATVGHALYSIWEPTLSYADANHDGVIEPNEVTLGPLADQGTSLPTRGLSLRSALGVLGGHLRFGGLLDYQGGNRLIDQAAAFQAVATARGANDPRAPLAEQAQAAVVGRQGYVGPTQDASFLRLRELSVTYAATPALAHRLHTGTAALSLLARNLWLSTRYSGPDPEVDRSALNPATMPSVIPLPRYFVLRLTLGY